MFTLRSVPAPRAFYKFLDSLSGGADTPSEGGNSNWPYAEGHETGFKKSTRPPIPVASIVLPNIGAIMEGVQGVSARTRDAVTLAYIGTSSTMNKVRKAVNF